MRDVISQLKISVILLILFTILTGIMYPVIVTGLAQFLFPWQANGSLVNQNDKAIGSLLIGQSFISPTYFWSRPSATTPYPYNAASSSGSNMGPSNPDYLATVKERINTLRLSDAHNNQLIPVDLVTASGSGLDPEISVLAAFYQVPRIAKARNIPEKDIQELINNVMQLRMLGFLGEPRINVLQLNIALDTVRSNHVR